jgi:hypothetical protein
MHDAVAQAFLHTKLEPEVNQDGDADLAAAYVQNRAPHYSVLQYLEGVPQERQEKDKFTKLGRQISSKRRGSQELHQYSVANIVRSYTKYKTVSWVLCLTYHRI